MNLTCEQKRVSRCVFCGSSAYGKGCRYGPKGYHFHPNDPRKCSWCGSPAYGKGCRFNPNGEEHVHGIDYNPMIKENFKNRFMLRELNKKFTDFEAYKLGIINENGDRIKEPLTEQEKAAYSPETKTILKIKKYLGSKLDLINQTAILENASKLNYNKNNHIKVLEYEQKFNDLFAQLHETTDNAVRDGLTLEQVQALL
jgi:hypothetical protein